jgi:hypothetical protein
MAKQKLEKYSLTHEKLYLPLHNVYLCADIGTTFVLNGDGFVYPLQTEHPSFESCLEPVVTLCPYDFDGDGVVGVEDLLIFLSSYGVPCE